MFNGGTNSVTRAVYISIPRPYLLLVGHDLAAGLIQFSVHGIRQERGGAVWGRGNRWGTEGASEPPLLVHHPRCSPVVFHDDTPRPVGSDLSVCQSAKALYLDLYMALCNLSGAEQSGSTQLIKLGPTKRNNLRMSSAPCRTSIGSNTSSERSVLRLATLHATTGVLVVSLYDATCICEAHEIRNAPHRISHKYKQLNDVPGNIHTLNGWSRVRGRLSLQYIRHPMRWCVHRRRGCLYMAMSRRKNRGGNNGAR